MADIHRKIKRHKKAKEKIKEIIDTPGYKLIIHYSCESFYKIKNGRTPRITSIAVRYLESGQTRSFSIHKIAELEKIPIDEIENYYDKLEKKMLEEFYRFVKEHKNYTWLHWNMRDINYGFEAIAHRYRVLGGRPVLIDDNRKIDLASLFIEKYGAKYMGHPRLERLIEKNRVSKLNFLSGREEAESFEKKEYIKLHQSTLKKVDVITNLLKRSADEDLKTNVSILKIYGISPQGIFELIKDHWIFYLIYTIITLILGAILGVLINKLI